MAKAKSDSTAQQLLVQLRAQAAGILAEGVVLSSFRHRGLSGIEREEPVRRFLRVHLPGRFLVGQGAIASADTILQQQHDIIVADKDVCFTLLNTLSAQLMAVESVHLIVEVRSRASELKDVAKSLRAVRALQPSEGLRDGARGKTDPGVHTVVIYQGPKAADALIKQLKAVNATNCKKNQRLAIDFVLVLAENKSQDPATGYLIGYSRKDEKKRNVKHHYYPKKDESGLSEPKVIERGAASFGCWYAAVLNHLNGVRAYPPFLYSYIGRNVRITDNA